MAQTDTAGQWGAKKVMNGKQKVEKEMEQERQWIPEEAAGEE